jgi:hypothetical protein
MPNHFNEFSVDEIIDAYIHFSYSNDLEACKMVSDAFDSKTSINLVNFSIQ